MGKHSYYKDKKKQYLRKFRIYPEFLYFRLDKWLKSMSLKGWHIVHCGMFFFTFEKGEPKNKEYFTYGVPPKGEGKYSISLRYPMLEKTYGVNRKKSKINANEKKTHNIVEIDLNKIDVEHNVGYREMISDRNKLHIRFFLKITSAIAICALILLILHMFD